MRLLDVSARRIFITVICSIIFMSTNSYSQVSKNIDLSLWGISDPSQIGYVSVGILHKKTGAELMIYDIRKQMPDVPEPSSKSATPRFDNGVLVVSNFSNGNVNELGGYFNPFLKAPSFGTVGLSGSSAGDTALKYTYNMVSPGYTGFYIQLFDFKATPSERVYLDATPFKFLTFKVKGSKGGEPIILQVADRTWEKKEDSLVIGDVAEFLPAGKITTEWQQAWVPMTRVPATIKVKELADLVLRVTSNGAGSIFVKDLAFTVSKDVKIPPSKTASFGSISRGLGKGMWLWETDKITASASEIENLKSFCRSHGVTDLFLQVPYDAKRDKDVWTIIWDPSKIKALMSALGAASIKVHALDGDPKYALTEYHGRTKALVAEIIKYNAIVPASERFVGVRYDNEPYLLPSFGGVQKTSVLKQYLDLLTIIKKMTSSAGLEFGADIPFWFDDRNEFYEPIAEIGGRPMSELIIDIVDNVGIMDYRTMAYGADGVIEHALSEIKYAEKMGKKVYVGLETLEMPLETLAYFLKNGKGQSLSIEKTEGTNARISLGNNSGTVLLQAGTLDVPASKLTFANKQSGDLATVMNDSAAFFDPYKSFYGFAIHSYEGYKLLLKKWGRS